MLKMPKGYIVEDNLTLALRIFSTRPTTSREWQAIARAARNASDHARQIAELAARMETSSKVA